MQTSNSPTTKFSYNSFSETIASIREIPKFLFRFFTLNEIGHYWKNMKYKWFNNIYQIKHYIIKSELLIFCFLINFLRKKILILCSMDSDLILQKSIISMTNSRFRVREVNSPDNAMC